MDFKAWLRDILKYTQVDPASNEWFTPVVAPKWVTYTRRRALENMLEGKDSFGPDAKTTSQKGWYYVNQMEQEQ
jgi:hypothetical protein